MSDFVPQSKNLIAKLAKSSAEGANAAPKDKSDAFGGLVSSFIRHPNAANLLMVLLILFGIYATLQINKQFFPSVDRPNINVNIAWPGASAEDVEINILAVTEPELRFVNGLDKITSIASEGNANIQLEFNEGTDMQQALADVEAAAKGVSNLPEDAEDPEVNRAQFFDAVARLSVSGTASEEIKRQWAKRIRDDLINRGIDKIDLTGLRAPELNVEISEQELRRLSLTVADISSSISSNSRDLPSGNVEGNIERQLRTLADARSVRALSDIEVKAFASGEKVLLGDVARITESYDDGATIGLSDNTPAIELDIRRAPTADTLKTAGILFDYIDEITPQLPDNIQLSTYRVSADSLSERINLLVVNGLGGLVIVVVTLFIFLNARIAFWVAAGIPIALLATIGVMLMIGQTINMITLFALIMMLGIIVDDAIVVGEHTNTRLEMGDDPITAAENGVGLMITPVVAAMLTTLAAFMPIMLIKDTIGQIMGVFPFVVIAVLIASLVECFLILPGHLAHSLKEKTSAKWSYWRQFFIALCLPPVIYALAFILPIVLPDIGIVQSMSAFIESTKGALSNLPTPALAIGIAAIALLIATAIEYLNYRSALSKFKQAQKSGRTKIGATDGWFRTHFDRGFNWFKNGPAAYVVSLSYHWRYVTLAISAGLVMVLAVGLLRGGKVDFVFFPSPEAENITGIIRFNAGLPESEALKAIAAYETALKRADEDLTDENEDLVKAVFTTFGASSRSGNVIARIGVQLTSSEVRSVRTPDIISAWRSNAPAIAGVSRFSVSQSRGGPPGRDIDIRLQGDSSQQLKLAANDVSELVSTLEGVTGVEDNIRYGKPELVLELTPYGSALGFTIDNVGRQIRNNFEGIVPFRFARGDDEVTVRVVAKTRENGMAALRNMELKSASGEFVPLTEIVNMTERQGFASIRRRDGKTTVSVTGDIDDTISTTDKAIESLEASGELRAITEKHGVTYVYGGRSEEQRRAFSDLGIGAILAVTVIYIILAWFFGSYWRPIAVMLIIPFGIVGAIFGHWLLGFKLTILSFIGLLGLAGILVNDSIILVARLDERLKQGNDIAQAAIGASLDRLRAVLLTSLTTIGGLLPLLFETSLQAQFLLPMAITIVFGLALATFLVLFLVPALIGIGYDIQRSFSAIFGHRQQVPAE